MAQSLYQFVIDDDSPEIAYFPFVNTEPSSNLSAGWQLLYTGSGAATKPGQVGNGTSSHFTTLNGASFLINWNGTGIDLTGIANNSSYNISLDGVSSSAYSPDPDNSLLASFNDLDNTNHSLLLTTIIMNSSTPNSFLAFDKARITYAPPTSLANTTYISQSIPDSDVAFTGLWSYSAGNSMHISNSAGDTAETTFQGSAITIYGLTSSYCGNFTVTLDNTTTSLSALSSYNNSDSLLFYATDLPQNFLHHISVTNQENRTLALQAGGMNFTCFGNCTTVSSSSSSRSTITAGSIAAIVLGVVLFLVVLSGIFYYACFVRRKRRSRRTLPLIGRTRLNDRDVEWVTGATFPPSSELESTSLSASKGYGFGLGLRIGLPLAHRKGKTSNSSGATSRYETNALAESHPMTPRWERDEKVLSINTLSDDFMVPPQAPESEKLAPGWSNPVARIPSSFKYGRSYAEAHGFIVPELRVEHISSVEDDYDDDTDVKTLTSRQDETLAATLSLSPRISEANAAADGAILSQLGIQVLDYATEPHESQQPDLLQVRDTSPFRVDVSAIFGSRRGNLSRGTSGSAGSTWSKVRARLYRKAHRDDGKQSDHADRQDTSSSSGPESVPVVMHESSSAMPPSETSPDSGTFSFLDLTASQSFLPRDSKAATSLTSAPAEPGHKDISTWSENTSVRMVRVERSRDDILTAKPDAPSTASGGSHPSDDSGTEAIPSALTQSSLPFTFPIAIPSSAHVAPPSDHVPERQFTPSPPNTPPPHTEQYLHIPQPAPPELSLLSASSPTESVPFSVSDIYFRNSFSDYAGFDSRRASQSSVLPPHPPLPHVDGIQTSTPTYAPPPYIVQRVLGLTMSPLSPISPASFASTQIPMSSSTVTVQGGSTSRSGTSPTSLSPPVRVGSLLGPRPRPSTAGSIRGTAPPQLPMQGRRGSSRGPR